jgi:hypothetical protein
MTESALQFDDQQNRLRLQHNGRCPTPALVTVLPTASANKAKAVT